MTLPTMTSSSTASSSSATSASPHHQQSAAASETSSSSSVSLPLTSPPSSIDSEVAAAFDAAVAAPIDFTIASVTTASSPADAADDDSDMFGPPRTSPLRHTRPRVPMISAKLRLREERKRVLQLCAHKLERIKDTEANLRRSVCINNTYSRLTDEVRREKHSRYLAQLPKMDSISSHDSFLQPDVSTVSTNTTTSHHHHHHHHQHHHQHHPHHATSADSASSPVATANGMDFSMSSANHHQHLIGSTCSPPAFISTSTTTAAASSTITSSSTTTTTTVGVAAEAANTSASCSTPSSPPQLHHRHHLHQHHHHHHHHHHRRSSATVDADLESLDRELNALDASMPLVDPEITQGAEQLEKAASRKRSHAAAITSAVTTAAAAAAAAKAADDENDRLVREALAQFYLPATTRLLSAIDDADCPLLMLEPPQSESHSQPPPAKRLRAAMADTDDADDADANIEIIDVVGFGGSSGVGANDSMDIIDVVSTVAASELDFELGLVDHNQNQKEFDVILDALRLGSDSCGQAAMMGEAGGAFHNLVVASLET